MSLNSNYNNKKPIHIFDHMSLNSNYNDKPVHIFDHISLSSNYNNKCFRQTLKIKSKHILYIQYFFLIRAVYKIM